MTPVRLKYLHHFADRHGVERWYFRRHGKRIALPGTEGSSEFMDAYRAALAGANLGAPTLARTKPGTIAAAITGYFQSHVFLGLSRSTQKTYRGVLESLRAKYGDKPIAGMETRHVTRALSEKADTPHAARNLLKRLRSLMRWALSEGLITSDPTIGVSMGRLRTAGFRTWPEEHVAAYRAKLPLGTRARLALEILANTGLRRSDVVRLGRQNVRNSEISIRLQKTGVQVDIPVLPDLQQAIDAMPASTSLTFLMAKGKSFTAAGFGGWFRERCDEAGIPAGYSAHGLRKLAATRMAEPPVNATAHQLKAWFGWSSLRQAEVYTAAADRKRLALEAGRKFLATSSGKP